MSRLRNAVLASIRSENQKLEVRHPPKNWCIVLRQVAPDSQGRDIAYTLAKWDTVHGKWLSETLIPLANSHEYVVYQESRYTSIKEIETDAKELEESLAHAHG